MSKKGRVSTKILKTAFFEAMEKTFGNITLASKQVGINRQTVYLWERTDPDFKERLRSEEYNEIFMDAVEAKLAKLGIQDENPTVLIFLAKTKGKKRGYIEKSEIDHTTAGERINPIKIEVTKPEYAEELKKLIHEND